VPSGLARVKMKKAQVIARRRRKSKSPTRKTRKKNDEKRNVNDVMRMRTKVKKTTEKRSEGAFENKPTRNRKRVIWNWTCRMKSRV